MPSRHPDGPSTAPLRTSRRNADAVLDSAVTEAHASGMEMLVTVRILPAEKREDVKVLAFPYQLHKREKKTRAPQSIAPLGE